MEDSFNSKCVCIEQKHEFMYVLTYVTLIRVYYEKATYTFIFSQ